ncbi:MAG: hypothetical protein Q8M26_09570 [Pseudolabrys sp.]|nr:hypothetical protein [Pseudolabrys sp.]
MTAQQYLLDQAQHCRRAARDSADRFVAEELRALALRFEAMARQACAASDTPAAEAA